VIDRRIHIVFLSFIAMMGLISAWMVHLQVFTGFEYARKAFRAHYRRVEIHSRRGVIWDRNRRILAVSLACDSLCADPHLVLNPNQTAAELAEILPGMYEEYLDKLTRSGRRFVWLHRGLSPEQAREIGARRAAGLFFREENRRFYPFGTAIAPVIGFTGVDGSGLEGLEASYNEHLSGAPGVELIAFDALARPYSSDSIIVLEPECGQDLHLTLDKTIQYFAATELKHTLGTESARWGAVVVMNVHTGEILAMASEPAFNPYQFSKTPSERRRNRCVSQLIEPGSTFKAIPLVSVLESGVIEPDDIVDCENGRITLGRHTFNDWKSFDALSVEDVIVFSSNVGTIKIAQRVGGAVLYSLARDLGIGSVLLPDFPGSETGYIRKPDLWTPEATASLSIGYGVAVTPLHLAVIYAACANGGYRVHPHLVKGRHTEPPVRIMNARTASIVADILRQAVARGTGAKAAPRSFSAAGKTGTARRYDHDRGGYDSGSVTCVFAGFAPAENPIISVCVVIDDPREHKWASQVTTGLFSRVVDRTLLYLGESPGEAPRGRRQYET
jgi:cell division protein FtsI (penicillin-binding protein 3)